MKDIEEKAQDRAKIAQEALQVKEGEAEKVILIWDCLNAFAAAISEASCQQSLLSPLSLIIYMASNEYSR